MPGASAEGRAVSLVSGETPEICTTKPLSNSGDRVSGKNPTSSTRKERRRDITATCEIKCKVESFKAEADSFKNFYGSWAGEVPKNLRERKIWFLYGCSSYDLVG